jgi:hypothetical protein
VQILGFGNKAIYYVGAVVPSLGWLSGADSKLTDMVVSCGGSGRASWPSHLDMREGGGRRPGWFFEVVRF